jgi:tol-pal system protein YbgF
VALTVALAGVTAGCGLGGGGAKPTVEAKAPVDPASLRQDVDRLRAELAELRTALEAAQRAGADHADRAAGETRSELDAVQKALEASARHDLQRQVEVLDAQARRIDLLDKRAVEQGQTLRRLELTLTGIESQLTRILENPATTPRGTKAGAPAKPPATASQAGTGEASPKAPSEGSGPVAGADLTPPAMLGLTPGSGSSTAAAKPADAPREAKAAPAPRASADEPSSGTKATSGAPEAKAAPAPRTSTTEPSSGTKATAGAPQAKAGPAPRTSADEPSSGTKATSGATAAKVAPAPGASTNEPSSATKPAAPPPRSSAEALPRVAKPSAPAPAAGASPSARAIFDRAMESWRKGETGQAVLDFEELVQTYPGDPLVAPAQFRIGEAYYAARDFERAALGYRKAIELAPQGKDTPQALLRLGLAYRAQKRESDARQAWNQLVRDFPDSEATEEARRALRTR